MSADPSAQSARREPEFDLDEIDRLLTTTRAVRKRLDLHRAVPAEVIEECLDIALQAPSGSNSQGWRWIVVTDPARRSKLGAIYRRMFEAYITPRDPGPSGSTGNRIMDSATYLAEHLGEVPVHIIPCALERPDSVNASLKGASFYGGILPAVWSLQLALRSRGLGSAWTTLHLRAEQEVAELLGIPASVTQVALLPVAWYTGEGFRPAPRVPGAEVTYWDSWDRRREG